MWEGQTDNWWASSFNILPIFHPSLLIPVYFSFLNPFSHHLFLSLLLLLWPFPLIFFPWLPSASFPSILSSPFLLISLPLLVTCVHTLYNYNIHLSVCNFIHLRTETGHYTLMLLIILYVGKTSSSIKNNESFPLISLIVCCIVLRQKELRSVAWPNLNLQKLELGLLYF